MSKACVVIFNDTHGWHSEQLVSALHALGIDAILTDLALCRIDLDSPTGLVIPGCENRLPDAVMVRGIAPGSLEQITFRMDILHTLAELGVPVFNSANVIELTVDKARTSLRLQRAGLASPRTWVCENRTIAMTIAEPLLARGISLVMKPLFGCQGKGIIRVNSVHDLQQASAVGETFYLQEYIAPEQPGQWRDWRLFVIDGEVCAAMSRHAQQWITNAAQGAQCLATTVTDDMKQLAIAAAQAVQADYAGVDLIRRANGEFTVLEVNSVPAWKGLFHATGIAVADHLAKALATRIQQRVNSPYVI